MTKAYRIIPESEEKRFCRIAFLASVRVMPKQEDKNLSARIIAIELWFLS